VTARVVLAGRKKFPAGRKILRNPPAGVAVYAAMPRVLTLIVIAGMMLAAGCATRSPTTATKLEPKIQAQVEKGLIEPGFTPEMVYLALGKPTEPAQSLADATTGDIVKPGFRRRVVSEPGKKSDVIKTEPIDPAVLPTLRANSLHVTFRDGRVVEIQRVAGI
jgi:hypothetical protein